MCAAWRLPAERGRIGVSAPSTPFFRAADKVCKLRFILDVAEPLPIDGHCRVHVQISKALGAWKWGHSGMSPIPNAQCVLVVCDGIEHSLEWIIQILVLWAVKTLIDQNVEQPFESFE